MMERYKGYWISGSALPGPPHTRYWESLGCVLKDGRSGSIIEVGRIQDTGITFDLAGLAAWYGMELSRMVVDNCFPQRERHQTGPCPNCLSAFCFW
jgi:hypothetical protein